MKIKIFRIVMIVFVILWMSVIFVFSAQDATESAALSGGLKFKLFSVFYSDFDQMSETEQQQLLSDFPIRKMAHFAAYFVLGAFAFGAFVTYKKLSFKLRGLLSLFVCMLYSASDEIHQYFVPGRSCEIRDMLIDTSGALLAILIVALFCRFSKKIYPKIKTGEC